MAQALAQQPPRRRPRRSRTCDELREFSSSEYARTISRHRRSGRRRSSISPPKSA
jgi:hypothetical protein